MKSTARKATAKKAVAPMFRLAPESIRELAKIIQPSSDAKVVSITRAIPTAAGARFTKLDSSGQGLPITADKFDAIHDAKTNLIWSAKSIKASNWADAKAKAAAVQIVGQSGRLPECDELLTLIDRSVFKPAVDHQFFKFLDLSDWYWSNTALASDPDSYAWYVYFYYGHSNSYLQFYTGLVLAVRSASQ